MGRRQPVLDALSVLPGTGRESKGGELGGTSEEHGEGIPKGCASFHAQGQPGTVLPRWLTAKALWVNPRLQTICKTTCRQLQEKVTWGAVVVADDSTAAPYNGACLVKCRALR